MARPAARGFTLIELLIVVAILALFTALLLPSASISPREQLNGVAQILAGDLDRCRSLAVANGSQYQVRFLVSGNRYVLTHTGSNSALDTLPTSAFSEADDEATEHIVRLDDLTPLAPGAVRLAGVSHGGGSLSSDAVIEFDHRGGTTQVDRPAVWLTAGNGDEQLYLSVEVDPITGLVARQAASASGPP